MGKCMELLNEEGCVNCSKLSSYIYFYVCLIFVGVFIAGCPTFLILAIVFFVQRDERQPLIDRFNEAIWQGYEIGDYKFFLLGNNFNLDCRINNALLSSTGFKYTEEKFFDVEKLSDPSDHPSPKTYDAGYYMDVVSKNVYKIFNYSLLFEVDLVLNYETVYTWGYPLFRQYYFWSDDNIRDECTSGDGFYDTETKYCYVRYFLKKICILVDPNSGDLTTMNPDNEHLDPSENFGCYSYNQYFCPLDEDDDDDDEICKDVYNEHFRYTSAKYVQIPINDFDDLQIVEENVEIEFEIRSNKDPYVQLQYITMGENEFGQPKQYYTNLATIFIIVIICLTCFLCFLTIVIILWVLWNEWFREVVNESDIDLSEVIEKIKGWRNKEDEDIELEMEEENNEEDVEEESEEYNNSKEDFEEEVGNEKDDEEKLEEKEEFKEEFEEEVGNEKDDEEKLEKKEEFEGEKVKKRKRKKKKGKKKKKKRKKKKKDKKVEENKEDEIEFSELYT